MYMRGWTADYVNDPYNDFEIVVEILYNDKDVGVIYKGEHGLEIKWYGNNKSLVIPVEWLVLLLMEVKSKLQ